MTLKGRLAHPQLELKKQKRQGAEGSVKLDEIEGEEDEVTQARLLGRQREDGCFGVLRLNMTHP